jgi:capsular exopolysaccharide synthesis family protein
MGRAFEAMNKDQSKHSSQARETSGGRVGKTVRRLSGLGYLSGLSYLSGLGYLSGRGHKDGGGHMDPRTRLDLNPFTEEEYQKLRGLLFMPRRDGDNASQAANRIKSLLVVGSASGEGATTTATLLAAVLAKANHSRLLLVDANLRTPSLANLFHHTDDPRGLTDVVLNDVPLEEVIRPTPFGNLWVMTGGRPLSSPSYLFDEPRLVDVLGTLREWYDLVILDGAPVKDYSDSFFLSAKVDGTIMVVAAEKTSIKIAQGTKRLLESSGAQILGAVLNNKQTYIPAFLDRVM